MADTGWSRWNNFYVEAVAFTLQESPGSDGLYLDGIAFDRTTLERVRKGMELAKPSVRVDIHQSNNGGCTNGGWGSPALRYMQHMAFADSLWFGEGFGPSAHGGSHHCHAPRHTPSPAAPHCHQLLSPHK